MPASDLVPCFYTGQSRLFEQPSEFLLRSKCHEMKKLDLGKFVDNGQVFQFKQKIEDKKKSFLDGPLGVGNLLPFAKAHNYGDKLHYEMPMAGDKTAFARSRRKSISVSSRVLFSQPGMQWMNYLRPASSSTLAG